jgi:hypothetical protein
MEDEQRNQMKTKLAISGLFFAVAIIAAWKVAPPSAAAFLFAVFFTASFATAAFAVAEVNRGVRK